MIPCSILNQQDGLRRLLEHTPEKGTVRGGIETSFLPVRKETRGEVLHQAQDLIAFALARSLDLGLLATPRPGVRERAPLREAGFIAKEEQGPALFGEAHKLGPSRGAPGVARVFVK